MADASSVIESTDQLIRKVQTVFQLQQKICARAQRKFSSSNKENCYRAIKLLKKNLKKMKENVVELMKIEGVPLQMELDALMEDNSGSIEVKVMGNTRRSAKSTRSAKGTRNAKGRRRSKGRRHTKGRRRSKGTRRAKAKR